MTENMHCAECGMLCEPASAFHPWLYCWLVKRGVTNPGKFLADCGFARVDPSDPVVIERAARVLAGDPGNGAKWFEQWWSRVGSRDTRYNDQAAAVLRAVTQPTTEATE